MRTLLLQMDFKMKIKMKNHNKNHIIEQLTQTLTDFWCFFWLWQLHLQSLVFFLSIVLKKSPAESFLPDRIKSITYFFVWLNFKIWKHIVLSQWVKHERVVVRKRVHHVMKTKSVVHLSFFMKKKWIKILDESKNICFCNRPHSKKMGQLWAFS